MMAPRRTHREDDSWVSHVVTFFMRWRGIAMLFGGLLGSVMTALTLAWKFSPRLNAVEHHQAMIDLHEQFIDSTVNSVKSDQKVLVRAACFSLTKNQQEWADMRCPDSLYKGAAP